jgi:hypothetical protein
LKYELRYDGIVEQSDDYDVLWKKSLLLQSEYIIYQCFESKIKDIMVVDEDAVRCIAEEAHKPKRKMSEHQVKQAVSEVERGYTKTALSRKYGVCAETISRYISEYENTHT